MKDILLSLLLTISLLLVVVSVVYLSVLTDGLVMIVLGGVTVFCLLWAIVYVSVKDWKDLR